MKRRKFNFFKFGVLAVAACFLFTPQVSYAVTPEVLLSQPSNIEQAIDSRLQQSRFLNKSFKHSNDLIAFYEQRDFQPYWVKRSGPTGDAEDFLDLINESWTHGVNPFSYHLEHIRTLWEREDIEALSDLDLFLTDAYVRIAQDLTGIRVNPLELKTNRRYWQKPFEAEQLLSMLNSSRDIERLMDSLAPQGRTYARLREELRDLVDEPAPEYEDVLPIRIRGALYPYEQHKAVPALRLRLGLDENTQEPYVYDDRLAAAIIRFQRENGLKDDGIIGRQTLNILNISREKKIHKVIANLERLRWVEEQKPDKFVVVNIPSATLWAVDDGRVEFEMPVIVGRKKRPTNMFITEIRGVRFNPNWTVPPTIKKDDILPKLQENPEYLASKGMELAGLTEEGYMTLDPTAIDWARVTEEDLKALRFVQDAGNNNPLGRVRVLMPNKYNIYLHDTNEKHYFERAGRAISSGCVRLKEPERMAEFIMENRGSWAEGDLEAMFAHGKTRDLAVDEPIPVYLLYYTVWMDQNGDLIYGNDLYDHDANLIKMLSDLDGIFIPVNNTEMSMASSGF